ncbi:MAG: hypothetical protein MJE77_43105 [Proteobacteria bacterium]|nr:hypothetical protein [Pseudomonadota bacterium]
MAAELLFVVAGLAGGVLAGVLIGRYYVPDDRMLRREARQARRYVRALNHVLSRDRDAAIDELKEIVSENVSDIEPYFALASLFRSRGEWERAIRVHQSISVRTGQDKKVRLRAHYELGLDFRTAGMPRRATRAMEKCLDDDVRHEGALQALCTLYEEQARYKDAAATWRRLSKLRGDDPPERWHHLLCAAAELAIVRGDFDAARRHVREIPGRDAKQPSSRSSVHLLAISAELALLRRNPKDATAHLARALEAGPDLARFLVPRLVEAQRELTIASWNKSRGGADRRADGGDELAGSPDNRAHDETAAENAAHVVEAVLQRTGSNGHLQLALADLRSQYDPVTALDDYQRIAEEFPALLPARVAAARLALASDDPDQIKRQLRALAAAGGVLDWAVDGSFRCEHCGEQERDFFWRCAHCRRWGTMRLDLGRATRDAAGSAVPSWHQLPRGGVQLALTEAAAKTALPTVPLLDSGSADHGDTGAAEGERQSVLDRVGGWFSGTFSGLRSKRKPNSAELDAATPAQPVPPSHRDESQPAPSPGPAVEPEAAIDDRTAPGRDQPGASRAEPSLSPGQAIDSTVSSSTARSGTSTVEGDAEKR